MRLVWLSVLENVADNDQPIFAVSQECHQLQPWNENLNPIEDAKVLFERTDCF